MGVRTGGSGSGAGAAFGSFDFGQERCREESDDWDGDDTDNQLASLLRKPLSSARAACGRRTRFAEVRAEAAAARARARTYAEMEAQRRALCSGGVQRAARDTNPNSKPNPAPDALAAARRAIARVERCAAAARAAARGVAEPKGPFRSSWRPAAAAWPAAERPRPATSHARSPQAAGQPRWRELPLPLTSAVAEHRRRPPAPQVPTVEQVYDLSPAVEGAAPWGSGSVVAATPALASDARCPIHAGRLATPPPALPCDSPPQPQGLVRAGTSSGLGSEALDEPCRLLSPGDGLVPSPHARRGALAGSYVNPVHPNSGAATWAVGAAVGGEAGALPASLGSGGTLHCNPVFADALQHSQRDVAALLETEAVRCVFIQDNPAYDGLRASLGLRVSAAAPPPQHGVLAVAQPGIQAKRAQLRAGLEAAAQPFAMVGRVEMPVAPETAAGRAGASAGFADPDVYVLAAADVVQDAVAAKQARQSAEAAIPIELRAGGSPLALALPDCDAALDESVDFSPLEHSLGSISPPTSSGNTGSGAAAAGALALDRRLYIIVSGLLTTSTLPTVFVPFSLVEELDKQRLGAGAPMVSSLTLYSWMRGMWSARTTFW
ncbi:hypothetical protein WJX81_003253 [Elliptochloris bilobata]|uniref:Uncharacterized protein n=1 Tax=Elliptochloris bilobata TaxID=381761 RepID=A0AAW1R2M9_9CHLO